VDVPPSPNDQNHDAGVFVEESIYWTSSGIVPLVTFDTNDATGAEATAHTGVTIINPKILRKSHTKDGFIPGHLQWDWRSRFSVWICNTAPSDTPFLPDIIYDASMRVVKYLP
jgi:hypothetical protein